LSPQRIALIESNVLGRSFNTNYTASWFLVRTEVQLDDVGRLKDVEGSGACEVSLYSRNSTLGPLHRARVDAASRPGSVIPLLGDGAYSSATLPVPLAGFEVGEPLAIPMTGGPRRTNNMLHPEPFPGDDWWLLWHECLQDYRQFAPLHRGAANILFADGGVRVFVDANGDGMLQNGFDVLPGNGFASTKVEIDEEQITSRWSLRDER
jgi:prepilin-type processing-associated H-X9-DG protein